MNKFSKTLVVTSAAFAISGGTALAQSPADAVYNPNQDVLGVVGSGTPAPTPTPTPTAPPAAATAPETTTSAPTETEETTAAPAEEQATPAATPTTAPTTETQQAQPGDLPFTGFEAGFVALAGLALLGGGLAMRRAAREQ